MKVVGPGPAPLGWRPTETMEPDFAGKKKKKPGKKNPPPPPPKENPGPIYRPLGIMVPPPNVQPAPNPPERPDDGTDSGVVRPLGIMIPAPIPPNKGRKPQK